MLDLVQEYINMHTNNNYDTTSLLKHDINNIRGLVAGTRSIHVLDYGCGKGYQYTKEHKNLDFRILDKNIYGYDPSVSEYSVLPNRYFDGVISTDVLEHIPEKELDETLHNIFKIATKFVYIAVNCLEAKNTLSDGSNAHCTIKEPAWWASRIHSFNKHKDIPLIVSYRV
jgi:2-polyprenyl-3-methyl-5-hydroxy-6-metoxy-1,4-benzoquinol methylase